MEISNLIPHIEALIFASEKPLTNLDLTELVNNAFGFMEDKITLDQVESAMEGIIEKYKAEFYPFEVWESGGGWQFLTKKEYHKTVAQLNGEKFLKRLSTAALETLAIIAYKQPVTKAEIEAIRGVSSDYAIQKLLEKDLVVITGRNEQLPGHPLVYATSKNFMDYFGINSPEDLPKLKEIFDDSVIDPTRLHEEAAGVTGDGAPAATEGEEAPGEAAAVTEDAAPGTENEETTEAAADTLQEEDAEATAVDETAVESEEGEEEEADTENRIEIESIEIEEIEEDNSDNDDDSSIAFSVGENGELIEEELSDDEEISSDDEEATSDDEDALPDDEDESSDDEEADPDKDKGQPGGEQV